LLGYALRMINDGVPLKKVRKSVLDEMATQNAEGGETRSPRHHHPRRDGNAARAPLKTRCSTVTIRMASNWKTAPASIAA